MTVSFVSVQLIKRLHLLKLNHSRCDGEPDPRCDVITWRFSYV